MSYFTGSSEAKAQVAEFIAAPRQVFPDSGHFNQTEKWPLWWTVLGLVTVCSLFWTALFQLIF